MAKTTLEKIAETKEKIRQYENQVKQLVQKQKEADRKARTRRLIERGALLESLIDGAEALTNEDVKAILTVALKSEAAHETRTFVRKRRDTAATTGPDSARGAEA